MADRKTFLNKNFNVNELKKIFKQIGGTNLTGLKKNQLINKIVALEKKNFNQTGGFGLNDIVNFFGNGSNINILDELEPDSGFLIGGDNQEQEQEQQGQQGDEGKKRRRKKKQQAQQAQQEQQQEQEQETEGGFNFSSDMTSSLDLDSTISSLNLDSSFNLDSSLNLDDLSATSF
jgi:hypothetical protein